MRIHPRAAAVVAMAWLLLLTACTRQHTRDYLKDSEEQLGLLQSWYGSDHRIFHSALLYPHGRSLIVNGYLVGIEKGDQEKVGGGRNPDALVTVEKTDTRRFEDIHGRLTGNRKSHIITHVLRYTTQVRAGGVGRMTQCALYSAMDGPPGVIDPGERLFEWCDGPTVVPPGQAFRASWDAIAALRRALSDDLSPKDGPDGSAPAYTHVIVYVMGWNTAQDEALENFNSLVGHLLDEADSRKVDFRPLVVGVTWPSLWALGDWSFVPDAIVRGLSFVNKADDAEEVGTTWLREVVERAVLPARDEARRRSSGNGRPGPRVVLVGHSFGARALVSAITLRAQLLPPDKVTANPLDDKDRAILLEGAFEIERLFDRSRETAGGAAGRAIRLPEFPAGNPRLTLTASVFDSAVGIAVWGWYAGDVGTYDNVCEAARDGKTWKHFEFSPFGCASARNTDDKARYGMPVCAKSGRTGLDVPLAGKTIRYFDASDLINCNAPFTGGGAHSDIYRRETARFILDEILSPP